MRRYRYISSDDYNILTATVLVWAAQTLMDSWVVGWYWYWFAVSIFGLPAMSFLMTVGVLIGLRFAINGFSFSRADEGSLGGSLAFIRIIIVPVVLWAIGYILAAFIG
jgi:hypothetical protein